jgi:histidinol phosphatase-like PHP family hydrolase
LEGELGLAGAATWHNHTGDEDFSYCADKNLALDEYARLLNKSPWERMAVTDHAFALALPKEVAWAWEWYWEPAIYDNYCDYRLKKTERYLKKLDNISDGRMLKGIEAEVMKDGRLSCDPEFREAFQVLIGAVHYLPPIEAGEDKILQEFMFQTKTLWQHKVHILAHPTRVLEARKLPVPEDLLDFIVQGCRASGVALEINSHVPSKHDGVLLQKCLASSTAVALGTDTHHIDEFLDGGLYFAGLLKDVNHQALEKILFQA